MSTAYVDGILASREKCVPKEKKTKPPEALRIFQLRKGLGLDQEEFARRLDVDQGTVSNWESGKRKPGVHTYYQLVKLAPRGSSLERELANDSGAKNKGDLIYAANRDAQAATSLGSLPVSWDSDLMELVLRAALPRFGQLDPEQFAKKAIFYYELCHKMKTEDPAMVEKFLKTA